MMVGVAIYHGPSVEGVYLEEGAVQRRCFVIKIL